MAANKPKTMTAPHKIIEHNISTLVDYVNIIEETRKIAHTNLWFRGCSNIDYQLLPSLYRIKNASQPDTRHMEVNIIGTFRQKSITYLPQKIEQDWDLIFYMQHYGFPTRLLDWTENPFVALYFALKPPRKPSSNDAVVWLCNPDEWNKVAMGHLSVQSVVLPFDNEKVKGYKSDSAKEQNLSGIMPAAIQGFHSNNRIIAQRGVFMIFGHQIKSMEALFFESSDFDVKILQKIIIPNASIADIRVSLRSIGFADTVVFPDIEGLSMEIKSEFGFDEV